MINKGVCKIPEAHILKRWMKKARDIIPAHLAKCVESSGTAVAKMFRHNLLDSISNEVVKIGELDPKAFQVVLRHLGAAKKELDELSASKPVEDFSTAPNELAHAASGSGEGGGLEIYGSETNIVVSVSKMKPPASRRHTGRPSNHRYHSSMEGRV